MVKDESGEILRTLAIVALIFSPLIIAYLKFLKNCAFPPDPNAKPEPAPRVQYKERVVYRDPPKKEPPPPVPTVAELIDSRTSEYQRRCAQIDQLPLPPEDKIALKNEQTDSLSDDIRRLMGK